MIRKYIMKKCSDFILNCICPLFLLFGLLALLMFGVDSCSTYVNPNWKIEQEQKNREFDARVEREVYGVYIGTKTIKDVEFQKCGVFSRSVSIVEFTDGAAISVYRLVDYSKGAKCLVYTNRLEIGGKKYDR